MDNFLTYKITFLGYWHIGSGLSGGADVDSTVLRDINGFPYIPGKTIKGLLREAAEIISEVNPALVDPASINRLFGERTSERKHSERSPGILFFSNAALSDDFQNQIIKGHSQIYLFDKIAATAIDDSSGTAVKHSLRKMEVTIPLELYGRIYGLKPDDQKLMHLCIKWVKRMGSGRNRGLGSCLITYMNN